MNFFGFYSYKTMKFLFLHLCIINSAQYIYASKGAIHTHFREIPLFPSITEFISILSLFQMLLQRYSVTSSTITKL